MTEQELHDARRSELLAGIQGALSGPTAPVPPKPLAADATDGQRAAFEVAQHDYQVLTTLGKSTGDVSQTEKEQLRNSVREWLANNDR